MVIKLKFLGYYSLLILFFVVITLLGDWANGVDPGDSAVGLLLILPVIYYIFDTIRR